MPNRPLLSLFFFCLFACASMVLAGIWFGEHVLPPVYFQIAASFFVVGLTSFLSWFVLTLRRIASRSQSPM